MRGLTKLIFKDRIRYIFILERKFLFMKGQHSISFTRSNSAVLGELQIRCNRNTKIVDTLYTFEFHTANFMIIFLVSSSHLDNMAFIDVKKAPPTYLILLRFCSSLPGCFACRCLRLPNFQFLYHLQLL